MSFSDLFSTSFSSRNRGHFSAIVRVALADGKIADVEKEFLDKASFVFDSLLDVIDYLEKNN